MAFIEKNMPSKSSNVAIPMVNLVEKSGISLVLVTHQNAQAEKMKRLFTLHEGKIV